MKTKRSIPKLSRAQIRSTLGPEVDRIFQALDGTPTLKMLGRLSRKLYATLDSASESRHPKLTDRVASRLVDSRMYGEDLKRSLNEMIRLRGPSDRDRLKVMLTEIRTQYIANQRRQLKGLERDLQALIKKLDLRRSPKRG
ncbi:MAG TPA: hypothetical protein VNO32_28460 [Candidatus Acidoferrum sp.]|nr:hypothetical protein [Candidatus Acidoferrum sp.]